jgi:hypothetical protein
MANLTTVVASRAEFFEIVSVKVAGLAEQAAHFRGATIFLSFF